MWEMWNAAFSLALPITLPSRTRPPWYGTVGTQLEVRRARDCLKNQNALLEVKRRTGEIFEVQRQLQATLDAIPDLLFEVGLDGRYYSYHSHHTNLLAASAAEFPGKKVRQR